MILEHIEKKIDELYEFANDKIEHLNEHRELKRWYQRYNWYLGFENALLEIRSEIQSLQGSAKDGV